MSFSDSNRCGCPLLNSVWPFLGGGAERKRREGAPWGRISLRSIWKDGRFVNPQPLWMNTWGSLGSLFRQSPDAKPRSPLSLDHGTARELAQPPVGGLRATWFGHSSVLLEMAGKRLLIDPVWSERASPVPFAGPKRWYAPVMPLEELPGVDAVLISHDHYDHLDQATVVELAKRGPRFIVPLGVGKRLRSWGVSASRITELDWWERVQLGAVQVVSTPARHSSGRSLLMTDRDRSLWSGYAFISEQSRVFYSGDTGMMEDTFAEIGERLGPFDLTLVEIGEYAQEWPDWHSGPEQALRIHELVRGRLLLPVHWGLFTLAPHAWTEPIERLLEAARAAAVPVALPRPGGSVSPQAPGGVPMQRWWPELAWRKAEAYPIVSTRSGRPNTGVGKATSMNKAKQIPTVVDSLLAAEKGLTAAQVDGLVRELGDLAFDLDKRGEPVAADVAQFIRARLKEMAERGS